jgi:LysM repeat protein
MKKTSLIILIAIIASLMFSACTMSASTPPPVTPTTNLSEIARQATETAIAKTPKAGETQVPDETAAAETGPTATSASEVVPTATPAPTEEEGETEIVMEYPVPDSYTLHSGEFIFCLARRFNILPEDIMDYNGYEYGTLLYPGDTLLLPPNGRAYIGDRALQYHPATYTVISGDTLYSIACLYGDVDPRAIAAANDLDLNQALTPGTVLQIP